MDKKLNIDHKKLSQAQKDSVKAYLNRILKRIVEIDDTDMIADWIFTLIIDQNMSKSDTKHNLVQTLSDESQATRLADSIFGEFVANEAKSLPKLIDNIIPEVY